MVVNEAKLVLVESSRSLEVSQDGPLRKVLEVDDDFASKPLALAGDGLVRDRGELPESDDDWE